MKITGTSVSRLESSKTNPRASSIERYLEAAGASVSDLADVLNALGRPVPEAGEVHEPRPSELQDAEQRFRAAMDELLFAMRGRSGKNTG